MKERETAVGFFWKLRAFPDFANPEEEGLKTTREPRGELISKPRPRLPWGRAE